MSGLGIPESTAGDGAGDGTARRLIPMQVGSAVVYVEAPEEEPTLEAVGGFEAVGLDPTEAFARAGDALRECVKVVGDRLEQMGEAIKPAEVGIEFTITFDVEGKATIIPVLLTGKAKTAMGIKVSALWHPSAQSPDDNTRS
jgi:hypothetical protein